MGRRRATYAPLTPRARRSGGSVGRAEPLRHRHVVRILAATGPAVAPAGAGWAGGGVQRSAGRGGPTGRRVVPEAGGIACVHAYAFVRHARGPLGGRVVRYDHRRHTATPLGPVPGDEGLRALFPGLEALPQLVVVFALDVAELDAKYGSRGTRFALAQVGHAAQNVGLRLAADRLRGHVVGGGLDHDVLAAVGLGHVGARYGGAVACGR